MSPTTITKSSGASSPEVADLVFEDDGFEGEGFCGEDDGPGAFGGLLDGSGAAGLGGGDGADEPKKGLALDGDLPRAALSLAFSRRRSSFSFATSPAAGMLGASDPRNPNMAARQRERVLRGRLSHQAGQWRRRPVESFLPKNNRKNVKAWKRKLAVGHL